MIKDTALRLGLSNQEAVVCMIVDDYWSVIDWSDGLWKNRVSCYDRLENCLRVASSEQSLRDFATRLAARMHVSAMSLSEQTLLEMRTIPPEEQKQLMASVRRESGLYLAALKIYRSERRKNKDVERISNIMDDDNKPAKSLWG